MSNKSTVHVASGVLTVDRAAPRTWDYRISDSTVGMDHRGQLELRMCDDNPIEAMCELIADLFAAAGARKERRDGGDLMPQEAEFPQTILDWVDANEADLTLAESHVQDFANDLGAALD